MNATSNDVLTGHPAKLKSGEWGAHIDGHAAQHGDIVRIKTKSGKEWDSVVERVVWKGEMDGKPCALAPLMPEEDGGDAKKKAGGVPAPEPAAGADDFDGDDLP